MNITDITVKKANGTTDVVYTGVTGSAGDKSPAVYKNKTVGTTPAQNPTFTLVGADNGTGTSRRMKFSGQWPVVKQDAGGNVVVSGRSSVEGSFLLPQNIAQADIDEVVHQFTGLLASEEVRTQLKTGYAAR